MQHLIASDQTNLKLRPTEIQSSSNRLQNDTPAHQAFRHSNSTSTSLSDDFLTAPENILWVIQEKSGRIRFALTTYCPLVYEDTLSIEVTLGCRNSPS